MLGYTDIYIETEEVAYPFDSQYYPLIRVFEAPYSVGDCPVDEVQLSEYNENEWYVDDSEDNKRRASIDENRVSIRSVEGNDYEIDKSYEVRIYPSDEIVPQELA